MSGHTPWIRIKVTKLAALLYNELYDYAKPDATGAHWLVVHAENMVYPCFADRTHTSPLEPTGGGRPIRSTGVKR